MLAVCILSCALGNTATQATTSAATQVRTLALPAVDKALENKNDGEKK